MPYIADPVIRNAIIDNGAQRKSELWDLRVDGNDHGGIVLSTDGLEFLSFTESLRLSQAGIEAVNLDPLVKMRRLRSLGLEHNQFDDISVGGIPYLPLLDSLSLVDNNLSNAGAVVPLIGRYGRSGISIDLGWNDGIDPDTLIALRPVLDRLHGLGVYGIDWLRGASGTVESAGGECVGQLC